MTVKRSGTEWCWPRATTRSSSRATTTSPGERRLVPLRTEATHTICPWKGEASYYDVTADGKTNGDAAWFYPEPLEAAAEIKDRVAFWKGVTVTED